MAHYPLPTTFVKPQPCSKTVYVHPKPPFGLVAILALVTLLAMHDLCVAEVGLLTRASMLVYVQELDAGSREPAARQADHFQPPRPVFLLLLLCCPPLPTLMLIPTFTMICNHQDAKQVRMRRAVVTSSSAADATNFSTAAVLLLLSSLP